MYAYVNASDCRLVALMPSSRGRPAAGHTAIDEATGISVTAVADDALTRLTTAADVKKHVSLIGAVECADIDPDGLLFELVKTFQQIFTAIGRADLVAQSDTLLVTFAAWCRRVKCDQ